MSTPLWILILAAVVVVVALGVTVPALRRARTARLRTTFGPEYDRLAAERGRRAAEAQLQRRANARKRVQVTDLPPPNQESYRRQFEAAQARFVDDPIGALAEADRLVHAVLSDRGYPADDLETTTGHISVDNPEVVASYRYARVVLDGGQQMTTEQIRQAFTHVRFVFGSMSGIDRSVELRGRVDEDARVGTTGAGGR